MKILIAALLSSSLQAALQIGGSYTYVNIKTEGLPHFEGHLGGAQGMYEYRPCTGLYAAAKVNWKQGSAQGTSMHRSLLYIDAQERVGYSWSFLCNQGGISLYSGFGYRYLNHRLVNNGYPSVQFHYNEFYVPVGFVADYAFNDLFSLGLNGTWMPQVFPSVEIVPLKGANWSLQNTMSNFLVELPLNFILTDSGCYFLTLKPFYERWKDGASTAVTPLGNALNLPGNLYNFWGVELNIGFVF